MVSPLNRCPHASTTEHVCMASFSAMRLDDQRKTRYCQSDEFDCCPLYLSRQLRHSRSRSYVRHIREAT